ncbi:MAG TPA: histidine kinase, partial [Xanthomonadaceae bacterium]|nr:histidine kinase [Xanthomonadaceae bacterium]
TLEGWCVLYFGIKHYLVAQQQRAKVLASEATARDAQLMALHYQLQPHFLFNTLNAISTLVVSRQPEKATEMISRLAGLLRNTLSSPDAHTVTLCEELAVVEEYLTIERVRFGSRLRVSLDASDEAGDAQVPRFLLQPLVENAIRHGIAHLPQGGEIAIKAGLVGPTLQIEVTNDTSKPEARPVDPKHGVGLANTRARLEQLYGTGNAELSVSDRVGSDQVGRFSVSLRLPLILDPIARGPVVARG